jgi:hypothetical protein
VIFMGWSRKRLDQNGKERYTAYYRDARGKTCVAGTFPRKKDADHAWKTAVEWLPNHVMKGDHTRGLHLLDLQAHYAVVRPNADEPDHAR